jgi:outer membrane protein assembly factor BamD (BamD/ComL family)
MLLAPVTGVAQSAAKSGPDTSTVRDPEIEKDSLHNLDVARQYFKLKKAYLASLQRLEEIIAGNPTFSKIDEVLYLAGESSVKLAARHGKQSTKMAPEQLKIDARNYFSKVVSDFPNSAFRKASEDALKELGAPAVNPQK